MRSWLMTATALLAWSLLFEWPSGHLRLELEMTHVRFVMDCFL